VKARISGAIALAVALLIPSIAALPAAAPGGKPENLLLNADFAKGAGNTADHWRTEAWDQKPDTTNYRWNRAAGANPGELIVDSAKPNDARWMQSLSLGAGWYRISVDARAEGVGTNATGVSISVMEDGIISRELKGNAPWTPLELYLKIGHLGADIEVALRLGGYGSLNTGHAFFRNPAVTKIAGPPPGAEHVFDLETIRKEAMPQPLGRPWSLVAVFILLGATAVVGWRLFGEAALVPAPVAPPAPKPAEKPKGGRPEERPAEERAKDKQRKQAKQKKRRTRS
jgi:hypothetical protein